MQSSNKMVSFVVLMHNVYRVIVLMGVNVRRKMEPGLRVTIAIITIIVGVKAAPVPKEMLVFATIGKVGLPASFQVEISM